MGDMLQTLSLNIVFNIKMNAPTLKRIQHEENSNFDSTLNKVALAKSLSCGTVTMGYESQQRIRRCKTTQVSMKT